MHAVRFLSSLICLLTVVSGLALNHEEEREEATTKLSRSARAVAFTNVALKKPARQSSTAFNAVSYRAVDGNRNGIFRMNSCSHTATTGGVAPWWEVDLLANYTVSTVRVYIRQDCCQSSITGAQVYLDGRKCGLPLAYSAAKRSLFLDATCNMVGRKLRIARANFGVLALCEVEAFGVPPPPNPCFYGGNCTKAQLDTLYQSSLSGVTFSDFSSMGISSVSSLHPSGISLATVRTRGQAVPFAVLSPVGSGWVLNFGHEGLLSANSRLVSNVMKAVRPAFKKVGYSEEFSGGWAALSSKLGLSNAQLIAPASLVGAAGLNADIYFTAAYDVTADVRNFVRRGGILITGGHGWYMGGGTKSTFNKVFWQDGIAVSDDYLEVKPITMPATRPANENIEAVFQAIRSVVYRPIGTPRNDVALGAALGILGPMLQPWRLFADVWSASSRLGIVIYQALGLLKADQSLWSIVPPVAKSNAVAAGLFAVQDAVMSILPATEIVKLPVASMLYYPGPVLKTIPRISRTVNIKASHVGLDGRWGGGGNDDPALRSTGLYAAPNEIITITVPTTLIGQIGIKIGLNYDSVWGHDNWDRFPGPIARYYPISAATTRIASPYGGPIYVAVPVNTQKGMVDVVIAGGVDMLTYRQGATNDATFKTQASNLANYPPVAEFITRSVIFTLPTRLFRKDVNLTAVAEFWGKTMDTYAQLANITALRSREDRITFDRQISAGWMHSGYPAMAFDYDDVVPSIFDVNNKDYWINDALWGFVHELGHNWQWGPHMPGIWGEVSNNLYILHAEEVLFGIRRWERDDIPEGAHLRKAERPALRQSWCATATEDPFIFLENLVQLREGFGWEPIRQLYGEYQRLPDSGNLFDSDQKKFDEFARRFCKIVRRDLTDYLNKGWLWNLSPAVTAEIKSWGFPTWWHDTMVGCTHGR